MKMAGNTKRIRGDAHGKPAPQFFNPDTDAYEYLEGADGASKMMAEDGKIAALGTTTDLDSANTLIGLAKALKGKDFATQTTLEAARALLETISGLDFSTETTLDSLKTFLEVLGTTADADSLNTVIGLLKNLKGKDFAEETTLDALKTVVEAIKGTDGIKKITDALPAGTNEIGEVVISGDETLPSSAPVTGTKTLAPGVAAEIFAGASRKANRVAMMVRNLSKYSEAYRLRFGESSVSDTKGFVLEPQSVVVLEFNPKVATPIYAIPETNTVQVEVYEV
jgi:hypothetical protein